MLKRLIESSWKFGGHVLVSDAIGLAVSSMAARAQLRPTPVVAFEPGELFMVRASKSRSLNLVARLITEY